MRAHSSCDAPAGRVLDTPALEAHGASPRPTEITPGPVALLLLGWVLVALGIATHDGRYALPSLALVVLGTLVVGLGVYASALPGAPPRFADARLARPALAAAALTVGLAPLVWHPRYFAHGAGWTASQVFAALAGLLAAATVLPRLRPSGRRWPFWTIAVLMTAAGATMVAAAGRPHIDVFWLLQGSTKGLVQGADMYRQQWAETRESYYSHGLFDVYPYLPWTSVLLAPFRLVFGDVRYGLVVCLGVAAYLARRLGAGPASSLAGSARSSVPVLLPLLLLVFPKVTYSIQLSWTEPLLIALLTGMVLAVDRGRTGLAIACLALAFASKQHIVLLLPLAAMWPRFGVRRTLISAGAAALLVLPWVIAGPRDFWHDAIDANLGLGYRADALCLATWVHKTFGADPGFALTLVGLLIAYALAWRIRGTTYGFCAGAGLLVLMLDVTNTQSFFNHYTLGMALVVLAIVVGRRRQPNAPAGDQRLVEKRTS